MDAEYEKLQKNLVLIGTEMFRFQHVFERILGKLSESDKKKYTSQFSWFVKRVHHALEEANLTMVDLTGQDYDPGMAISPLNLDDFSVDAVLFIEQMVEPIIMENGQVIKTGTAILGRKDK